MENNLINSVLPRKIKKINFPNEIYTNNNLVQNPQTIADVFNSYFCSIG